MQSLQGENSAYIPRETIQERRRSNGLSQADQDRIITQICQFLKQTCKMLGL